MTMTMNKATHCFGNMPHSLQWRLEKKRVGSHHKMTRQTSWFEPRSTQSHLSKCLWGNDFSGFGAPSQP